MIRLAPLIFVAFVIVAFLVTIAVVRNQGAEKHPLLVDSAAPAQEQPAFRLFTPCPLSPKNIPLSRERDA